MLFKKFVRPIYNPYPPAYCLPSKPSWLIIFPVIQAKLPKSLCPNNVWYVSFIHAIYLGPVPRSGPMTSILDPIKPRFASSTI